MNFGGQVWKREPENYIFFFRVWRTERHSPGAVIKSQLVFVFFPFITAFD